MYTRSPQTQLASRSSGANGDMVLRSDMRSPGREGGGEKEGGVNKCRDSL